MKCVPHVLVLLALALVTEAAVPAAGMNGVAVPHKLSDIYKKNGQKSVHSAL